MAGLGLPSQRGEPAPAPSPALARSEAADEADDDAVDAADEAADDAAEDDAVEADPEPPQAASDSTQIPLNAIARNFFFI